MNICFIKEDNNPIGSLNHILINDIDSIEYQFDKLKLNLNKESYEEAKQLLKPEEADCDNHTYTIFINSYYTEVYEGKCFKGYLIYNALYPYFEIHS